MTKMQPKFNQMQLCFVSLCSFKIYMGVGGCFSHHQDFSSQSWVTGRLKIISFFFKVSYLPHYVLLPRGNP